LRRLR